MVPAQDTPKLFAWAAKHRLAMFPIHAFHKAPGAGLFHTPQGIAERRPIVWNPIYKDFSFDPAQWQRWYDETGGCNYGVVCGPSRLIVIDVDTDAQGKPFELDLIAWLEGRGPEILTTWVATPRGGWHLYYRLPADWVRPLGQPDLVKDRIDTRAGNGYVVAPWSVTDPSVAADGSVKSAGAYVMHPEYEIKQAFEKLLDHCVKKDYAAAADHTPDISEFHMDGLPLDLGKRYQAECAIESILVGLRDAQIGGRNHALNVAAVRMGHYVASYHVDRYRAHEILMTEGQMLGLESGECRKTIASGMNKGEREPAVEPRSAIPSLLLSIASAQATLAPAPAVGPLRPVQDAEDARPIVEKLVEPGRVTILSGATNAGKTSFALSLAAADIWGLRHMMAPGQIAGITSTIFTRPAAWLVVTFESISHLQHLIDGFGIGHNLTTYDATRLEFYERKLHLVRSGANGRGVVLDRETAAEVRSRGAALVERTGRPLVIILDNVMAAVENTSDEGQAKALIQLAQEWAAAGAAVVLIAHPTKAQGSQVSGHGGYLNLADNVAFLETLRQEDTGWTQWIDFSKHRTANDGWCMEIVSARIEQPIVPFPRELADGNDGYWLREQSRRRVSYARAVSMRKRGEKPKKTDIPPVNNQPTLFAVQNSPAGEVPAPPKSTYLPSFSWN